MILFNINLVLQSELSPEKRKKGHPAPPTYEVRMAF